MYSNAVVFFDGREVKGTLDMAYEYEFIHTDASRAHPGFSMLPDKVSVIGKAELAIALRV